MFNKGVKKFDYMFYIFKKHKTKQTKKITDRNKIKMTSIQQNIDITAFYTGCPFNMTNEDLEEPEPGNYMCLGYFPVILTIRSANLLSNPR